MEVSCVHIWGAYFIKYVFKIICISLEIVLTISFNFRESAGTLVISSEVTLVD